jgi:hypothetical protein
MPRCKGRGGAMKDLDRLAWVLVGAGSAAAATSMTGIFIPATIGWTFCAIGTAVAITVAVVGE